MNHPIRLFLSGDVMTGRGIDQILPHPGDPQLHESYVKDARDYVVLAERANGPVPRPVDFDTIWGDALAALARAAPDLRIVNLETAVTRHSGFWRGKEVHYRMSPENIPCLTAAGIDACVLANNHVLDWGVPGLEETLESLHQAGIPTSGAGRTRGEAEAPATLEVPGKGRALLFAFGSETSGIPPRWAASGTGPGINLLPELSAAEGRRIAAEIRSLRKPGDLAVVSIHWGGNWGYGIPAPQRDFARALIEEEGADLIHGHSSHHVKGMEVHGGKLILYGCGDLLTDYEGISGYEEFRGDLGLLYLPELEPGTGRLLSLRMMPMKMHRLRLQRTSTAETRWLAEVLTREGRRFNTRGEVEEKGTLALRWN